MWLIWGYSPLQVQPCPPLLSFLLTSKHSLTVYRGSAFRGTLLPLMFPPSFCQQTLLLCTFKAPASPFPSLLRYHGLLVQLPPIRLGAQRQQGSSLSCVAWSHHCPPISCFINTSRMKDSTNHRAPRVRMDPDQL